MKTLGDILDSQPRGERPADAVLAEIMAKINVRFYKQAGAQRWLQDQKPLMLALTWPASWMAQRGVSLPMSKYEAILREILNTIAKHGETAKIKHFPTYLQHCVRQYFAHQGDDLCQAQKSLSAAVDLRFLQGLPTKAATPTQNIVETMAAAHRVLAVGSRKGKVAKTADSQPSLFDV